MAKQKQILEKAGQYLGSCWEVQACRPPQRGELVYNPCYDRIQPSDGGIMCAVIVETLPGWEELLAAPEQSDPAFFKDITKP